MRILNSKISFLLALGDIFSFTFSLFLTLIIRYGFKVSPEIVRDHVIPFAVLFVLWVLVFLIAGLYEKRSVIFRRELLSILLKAQAVNAVIAVAFFYFATFAKVAPKTNLFIYLFISSVLIILWRTRGAFSSYNYEETALMLAHGPDVEALQYEIKTKKGYALHIVTQPDGKKIDSIQNISVVIFDAHDPKTKDLHKDLYQLIFSHVQFIDITEVYENVFGRVPLSLVNEGWFLENISTQPKMTYEALKRGMDIILSGILGIASLVLYPLVILLIATTSKGPVFIFQKRIGKDNQPITIPKFRTMIVNDGGAWITDNDNRITTVGKFLRATRIDELPQLFSVIKGDMSLIGPRPDIYDLGEKLAKEIPYYKIRNVIKPGLSGWAQIEQQTPPQSLEETTLRLAYDFYYIKNRSFVLDLKIALRTIKTLLSRVGR